MSKETDVLIVGSGPMGLSLACQLVRYGFGCIIITENGGSYTTIQSTDSQQTKYLAGCDGDGNSLQTAPDLHFIGNTFEEPFYVANIQLNWELPSNKLYIGRTRNSFIAFFPIQRTRIWQILGHLSNAVAEDEIHSTAIEDHVEIPLEIAGVNWFLIYRVLFRHVDQFSAAPRFLVGDTAHIHIPTGAQDMNTGLQDVYHLAWKLLFSLYAVPIGSV